MFRYPACDSTIIIGGGGGGGGVERTGDEMRGASTSLRRPTLALSSALVPQTLSCLVCVEDS